MKDSAVREILGAGTFAGISLFGSGFQPVSIMILPPGAFLTLGCLLAVINIIVMKRKKNKTALNSSDEKEGI